jgi:hypothetical protein
LEELLGGEVEKALPIVGCCIVVDEAGGARVDGMLDLNWVVA